MLDKSVIELQLWLQPLTEKAVTDIFAIIRLVLDLDYGIIK